MAAPSGAPRGLTIINLIKEMFRWMKPTLRKLYLPPYKAAVDAGAMSVMASFSSWRTTKMHAQKYLLTDVLKNELGFKGLYCLRLGWDRSS